MAEDCKPNSPDGFKCIRLGQHVDCTDGEHYWDNLEAIQAIRRGPVKKALHGATVKQQIRAAVAATEPERHSAGIPVDAETAWSRDAWQARTRGAFRDFLRDRSEPFTTAEHFWPLIDAPREMRALSTVVRGAIRDNWIEEHGAVRLREVYHSRDGVQFAMNKLVPVYVSLIVAKTPALSD